MSKRADIAVAAATGLRDFAARIDQSPVTVGFDGFVDSIIKVVDQRHDADHYTTINTIDAFGRKIVAAAGQSSNYELVTKLEKLGGNGPIMANALASIGLPTTYIGALGYPGLHPVFEQFAKQAEVHSICDPGFTDALEFNDGKLMLGKYEGLKDVNAYQFDEVVGLDKAREIFGRSVLIGMVNWTMLLQLGTIWDYLVEHVLPGLDEPASGRRMVFIDLADPEKRTREDLRAALDRCAAFQEQVDVLLGYNLKESVQVAKVLGVDPTDNPEAAIEQTAAAIREALGVHTVVIHPRAGAAAATKTEDGVETARFAGPLVKEPKLSTGAGDNFNAGFCLGRIAKLPLDQSLCVGTATSGFYVRNAASPTLTDLADFCDDLPEPE